jgi:hypothetical protein
MLLDALATLASAYDGEQEVGDEQDNLGEALRALGVREPHRALDVTHMGVLEQDVELLTAARTPETQRLHHDVHPELVSVAEAVDERFVGVVDADRRAVELVRLDAVMERGPRELGSVPIFSNPAFHAAFPPARPRKAST